MSSVPNPLFGLRIMVTRAVDQAESICRRLREHGANVLLYPTIATSDHLDPEGWDRFRKITAPHRWLVFTSENGVRYFFRQLHEQSLDPDTLGSFKTAAVGPNTAACLRSFALQPDFIASRATGENLAREMATQFYLKGSAVVRIRGNLADEQFDRAAAQSGLNIIPLTVYETTHPIWSPDQKAALAAVAPEVVIFASGSSVDGLYVNLTPDEINRIIRPAFLVSIGPSTSDVMRRRGLHVHLEAVRHTIPDLIDELAVFAGKHPIRRKE